MAKFNIKKLVVLATLLASEMVISRFLSISTPLVKIGFGFIPILFVAYLYGPLWAGTVWAVSDFLGAHLFPIAPYFFGFTLTAFLSGLVLGLFLYNRRDSVVRSLLPALIVTFGLNLFLDTYWLIVIMGTTFEALFWLRLLKCAITLALQFAAIRLIALRMYFLIDRHGDVNEKKRALREQARGYYAGDAFQRKREQISADITNKLLASEQYRTADTIFCFVGTGSEIDTAPLLQTALNQGKRVCVPLCGPERSMTARQISSLNELVPGYYGLLEPGGDTPIVAKDEIDLAIVPALLCDRGGLRVGYGGGYYDRYLKNAEFAKIAVCPAEMQKRRLPAGIKDIAVDLVVTEEQKI